MSSFDDYEGVEPEERGSLLGFDDPPTENRLVQQQDAGSMPQLSVSSELLAEDVQRADSWLVYNKGLEQTGYSPADGLTPENVDSLQPAYTVQTDGAGLETNPIVVPSDPPVMYYTVQGQWTVHAANARTGEPYWTYQIGLEEGYKNLELPVNRGAGVWRDKVYVVTPTPAVVAVDRYSGEEQWRTELATEQQDQYRLFLTQAPVVHDGTLLVGQSSDYATFTTLSALDAESGSVNWQMQTAPEDEWVGDTWRFSSAAAWMSPAVDPESNTAFFSIGNPDPMLNGVVRPGPNQKSCALMAVDVESGEEKWSTQISPHDLWDYDVHATPRVFDMEVDGETRRVVATVWKAGWMYVFDVEDGRLVERTAPFARQGGETFLELPPAGEENAESIYPAIPGGTEWPPDAYSPQTGYQYVGANNYGHNIWYDPNWAYESYDRDEAAGGFAVGGGAAPVDNPDASAEVVALDPATGDVAWETALPDVNPEWPPARLFTGGTSATAGGLVFHGSSSGNLVAMDAENGDLLWRHDVGNRITASPVVWHDPSAGRQFVAVASGGDVVVFTRGGEGRTVEVGGAGNETDAGNATAGNATDAGNSTE